MTPCEFCGQFTDDPHSVDEMLVCDHCILLVDLLEEFIRRGGTKEIWYLRPDGQQMMDFTGQPSPS